MQIYGIDKVICNVNFYNLFKVLAYILEGQALFHHGACSCHGMSKQDPVHRPGPLSHPVRDQKACKKGSSDIQYLCSVIKLYFQHPRRIPRTQQKGTSKQRLIWPDNRYLSFLYVWGTTTRLHKAGKKWVDIHQDLIASLVNIRKKNNHFVCVLWK